MHYIRYYGIYASRTKGKLREEGKLGFFKKEEAKEHEDEASEKEKNSSWARLIQKVYEIDPLVCDKCGYKMRVVAVIMDIAEIMRIKTHLAKKANAPPVEMASVSS